ncbi:hypothetical protein MMC07_003523 [Pseudocyphellaria aurata]|nr:hypothetical protein [Pseudocyphellaria aurata]
MELVIYGQCRSLGGKFGMSEEATLFGKERMPGFIGLVRGLIPKGSIVAKNFENSVDYTDGSINNKVVNKKQVKLDIRSGSLRVPEDAQRVPAKNAAPSKRHTKDVVMAGNQAEVLNHSRDYTIAILEPDLLNVANAHWYNGEESYTPSDPCERYAFLYVPAIDRSDRS